MIHRLHWDLIEDSGSESVDLLIWPGPINHDLCFKTAGFTDFLDPDAQWDRDFEELTGRLVDKLLEFGDAEHERPALRQKLLSVLGRTSTLKRSDLIKEIIDRTMYSYLPNKIVFGDVSLEVDNEHPLFVLTLPDSTSVAKIVDFVASNVPQSRTTLDWAKWPWPVSDKV